MAKSRFRSRIRIGDGPWVDVEEVQMTWSTRPEWLTVTLDQEPEAEAVRLRALGVDPGRVIDGETVRKEIAGG
jgi:hypothetical protein